MNQETAIVLSEVRAICKDIAGSKLLPTTLQGKPSDVLAVVLAGKELGLGPMTSLRGLDIIQGKLSMSSALIGALIQSSPDCEYLTPIEFTDKTATFETKRRGSPAPVRMSYTFEEARIAGLTGKDNYKKNPTAMLLARCQARIGRAVYPDKCLGVYDRDSGELDDLATERGTAKVQVHAEQVKEQLKATLQPTQPAVDAEFAEVPKPSLAERIQKAQSKDEIKALNPEIRMLGKEERTELEPLYKTRLAELQ